MGAGGEAMLTAAVGPSIPRGKKIKIGTLNY